MIKETHKTLQEIIDSIPKSAKVLDVGSAMAPVGRADYIIDILPFEKVDFSNRKDTGPVRFKKETSVQHDICSREKWPFPDKFFDYCLCSHTLEDIRDPLWVCSEILRVSKAGYIEIPSRKYETTFGLEAKKFAGASHHRWLIDLDEKGDLRFTFKNFYIHSKQLNKNRVKFDPNDESFFLKMEWKDTFTFYEHWLSNDRMTFEYFLNRPADKPITEKEKWKFHRQHQPHSLPSRWLRYLKNTQPFFAKIFSKYKNRADKK